MGAPQQPLGAPQQPLGAPQQLMGAPQQLLGALQQHCPREQCNGGPPLNHHRMPAVAHHGDVRLISGGPLATLFPGGGSPVVHQWQIPPSDSLLHFASGPPVAFWPLPGVTLSGAVAYGSTGAAVESTVLKHCSSYLFIITYIWHIQHL